MQSPYIATSIGSLIVIELTLTWELMSEIHLKVKDAKADDIYPVNVKADGIFRFLSGSAYVRPDTALGEIVLFMLRSFLKYSKNIAKFMPDYEPDLSPSVMTLLLGILLLMFHKTAYCPASHSASTIFLYCNFSNNLGIIPVLI